MKTAFVALAILATAYCACPASSAATPATPSVDLPTLRDIVQISDIDSVTPSPDGQWVAYRVLRPSLAANKVVAQWYRVKLDGGSRPVALGGVSEPLFIPEFGLPEDGDVRWSPDNRSLFAVLEKHSERQIYLLSAHSRMRQVTHNAADIEDFDLAPDGRSLVIRVRRPVAVIQHAQHQEAATGVHFDRTVYGEGMRLTGNFTIGTRETTVRRQPPPGVVDIGIEAFRGPLRTRTVPLANGTKEAPSALGPGIVREVLDPFKDSGLNKSIHWGPGDGSVRLTRNMNAPYGGLAVEAETAGGQIFRCLASICDGTASSLREIFVLGETGEIVILSEPTTSGRTGVYAWTPATGKVRTILAPTSSLSGGTMFGFGSCPVRGDRLICVQEGATLPPRLIALDLLDGIVHVLAAPNHRLAAKSFPTVRYLDWTDSAGRKITGVLMLPTTIRHPLPLVLTTYTCRGFLRGGTGMTAPEPILVQRGMAALCVNNNNRASPADTRSGKPVPAAAIHNAVDQYRVIIQTLAAQGIIDPRRVGIAGHSFSANVTAYAISHTDLFSAAVMGTGTTLDPASILVTTPTVDNWRSIIYKLQGIPRPSADPQHVLEDIAPSLNARNIKTPTLFQPPENEWLFCLQLYSAIQYAGGITDMYIYPRAGHDLGKFPSQHYWRNLRSVDWFDYWLRQKPSGAAASLPAFHAWEAGKLARANATLPAADRLPDG